MAKNQTVKLDFTKREVTGTGVCRKIRSKNLIPVVLYGPDYKSGLAGTVAQATDLFDAVDPTLTLRGIREIWLWEQARA